MTFEVFILGSNSATPIFDRHPSAQLVNFHEKLFLIDCGEGTQMQFMRYKVKYNRINHIFISHLHGDHYLGLMGLISTMNLQGRLNPLTVYANPALSEIINLQLKHSDTTLKYPLHFKFIRYDKEEIIFEDDEISICTILLSHRIPTSGFYFKEKPLPRKILINKINQYNIPFTAFEDLKKGKDYIVADKVIPNSELTSEPRKTRSYAYCSDTIYDEKLIPKILKTDLLYHEATFIQSLADRARETFHSTAREAATIAKKANVGKLLLGHFSARYRDLNPILDEAKTVFSESELAIEGRKFSV